jgi:hypothetical protein
MAALHTMPQLAGEGGGALVVDELRRNGKSAG